MSSKVGKTQCSQQNVEKLRALLSRSRPKYVRGNVPVKEYANIPTSIQHYFPARDNRLFVRTGVHEDGSCYYHTVASALNYKGYQSETVENQKKLGLMLRDKAAASVNERSWRLFWRKNKVANTEVPNYKIVKNVMEKPREWADVYAILYVCDMFNLNVIVFDLEKQGRIYCGTYTHDPSKNTLLMLWVGHAHFEPLSEYNAETNEMRSLFTSRKDGKGVLDYVLKKYAEQGCTRTTIHQILLRRKRRRR